MELKEGPAWHFEYIGRPAASIHGWKGGQPIRWLKPCSLTVKVEGIYCRLMVFVKSSVLTTTPENARKIGVGVLERVGNTPLLRLERAVREYPRAEFYAKAEWFNPGGSVKDRAALSMIREGERTGALRPGKTIMDATSGNTGIAYAMIGAALGYPVVLCLPSNASPDRKRV